MSISGEVRDSRGRPSARTGRPVLLDRLPGSFVASPGFAAAAGGAAILYGLALSVVWTGVVKDRAAPPRITQIPPVEPPRPPGPPPFVVTPPATPLPLTPAPPHPAPPGPTPPVAVAPVPTTSTPGKAETQVALNTQPASPTVDKAAEPPKPAPKPRQPDRDVTALGALIDPTGKAHLSRDGADVTLTVPGRLCFLSPAANFDTCPRALTGAEGDFLLKVRVAGEMKPGADPVKGAPQGVSFNGAGLLVWRDAANFLRLERGVATQNARNFFPIVVMELWKDGALVDESTKEVPDGPLSLRIEREDDELECSYSVDGNEWTEIKEPKVDFGERVEVGVLGLQHVQEEVRREVQGVPDRPPRLSPRGAGILRSRSGSATRPRADPADGGTPSRPPA